MTDPATSLPRVEFAFPGPLREQLVAAILDGTKTATTGLLREYEHDGEQLPVAGARYAVIDSTAVPVAVIETTEVRVVQLAEVDLAHARDEGEGHDSVAAWRTAHEEFWHSAELRTALDEPEFTVDDATPVVLERFRLVDDLQPA
ncbi:MAG: ASCH domain-containing protein [Streptomyces sp.]|uniref:ASCH domain-containing protein n=1 Tax=Streptomyces sp. TaxID=1931 RepID=UPI003D6C17E8